MQPMWVFSTPYSTLLTINISSQAERFFVCKKQFVLHINSFPRKPTKSMTMLYHGLEAHALIRTAEILAVLLLDNN
jgi:hypothetical protein